MNRIIEAFADLNPLSPPTYLEKGLQAVCEIYDFDFGLVFVIDSQGDGMVLSSHHLPPSIQETDSQFKLLIPEFFLSKLYEEGAFQLTDFGENSDLTLWLKEIKHWYYPKEIIGISLKSKGEVFGGCFFYSQSRENRNEQDFNVFQMIGLSFSSAASNMINQNKKSPKLGETNIWKGQSGLQRVFDKLAIGIALADADIEGRVVQVNKVFSQILGYDETEIIGKHFKDVTYHEDLKLTQKTYTNLLEGKANYIKIEKRYYKKDRTLIWGQLTASVIKGNQGEPYFIFLLEDISNRKRMEQELKESEKRFRAIFELAAYGIARIDLEGRWVENNRILQKMLGYTPEEIKGKTFVELSHPEDVDKEKKLFLELVKGKRQQYRIEKRFWSKSNNVIWTQVTASLVRGNHGEAHFCIYIVENITEKKQMEAELWQSERRFRTIFESAAIGIARVDRDGRIIETNKAAQEMLGYSADELKELTFGDLTYPEDLEQELNLYAQLMSGKINYYKIEKRYVCKDGTIIWGELVASFVKGNSEESNFCVGMIENINERKKMEEELLNSRKLESLGILAGGIAHDFNNILTVVLGNVSLAKMRTDSEEKLYQQLIEVEKAANQAKNLTLQLLTFAKGGAPILKNTSVEGLIEDSAGFALSGSNTKCIVDIPERLPSARIDQGQISQVLHNILINALQAMPDGGTIHLHAITEKITYDSGLPLEPGEYIKMSIKDQGHGIPEKYSKKVFDPYFTTKKDGSGLGLATSYSIIKKHNGCITLDSIVGTGTTFNIYIPVSDEAYIHEGVKEEGLLKGSGRVLIMDDDTSIREVVGEMLLQFGYDVDYAADGREVVEKYSIGKKNGCPFDAVIMDLTIPGGVGGKEALQILLKIDPYVKAIASSGYTNDNIMANHKEYGFKGIITKPFKVNELNRLIYEVIYS